LLDLQYLHSFPTRRSSDLTRAVGGCIIAPTILLCFGFVLLVGVAIVIGAGTGIQRYNDARRLVANGDQMLTALTLRHRDVQHLRSEEHTSELQSRVDLVCR